MIPYLVSKFAKSTLTNLVKESFGSDFPDIFRKEQIGYIYQYLNDLGAKSIVLEFDYIDRDYLEDYARYYVKRFSGSGSKCARLHFFSTDVNHQTIERALVSPLAQDEKNTLAGAYLGFMVIKPLPKTFVGRTCLRTYPAINRGLNRRVISRTYNVDLFGIRLEVDSVAFQEQDKVVAACATTAIWSSLHAIKSRPVRNIPACSEITIGAINHIDGSSNSFPSKELSNKQILRALDVEALRNHHQSMDGISQREFLKIARYHIDSDIPLILGASVYTVNEDRSLKLRAGHAVSVLGYKDSQEPALYIHDDRLGPYARAKFVSLGALADPAADDATWGLTLQEKTEEGDWREAHEILIPNSLIIPTHKKVRLPYFFADATCEFIVHEYEKWLKSLIEAGKDVASWCNQIRYTLQLSEISNLRQEVIEFDFQKSGPLLEEHLEFLNKQKIKFLTKSYARFHWAADFYFGDAPAFKILFDATDIPQGDAVAGMFVKDVNNANVILEIFRQYAKSREQFTVPQSQNFYLSFLKSLGDAEEGYFEYLNKTYGELRAPLYLKGSETEGGKIAESSSRKIYRLSSNNGLDEEFPELAKNSGSFMIWAIAHDGALIIGEEVGEIGHPALTGFKPARIAGELRRQADGWHINSKSGRYSSSYANANDLLKNALERFATVFYKSRDSLHADYFDKAKGS